MPGIVLSFYEVSALFLWFWIYLLSQPVESTHTGIPKLHLSIPATLSTPRVTEGAFGHLLKRALANIALPGFWAIVYSGVTLGPIDTRVVTRNSNIEDFVTRS